MASIPGTAWLIGASSGIGAALARLLAAKGWRVVISARGTETAASVAADHPEMISVLPLDVTDASACKAAVAEAEKTLGGAPDLVVFAAGAWQPMGASDLDPAVAGHLMTVNYLGAVNVLAALLPGYRERRNGHIAVIASVAGYRGLPRAAGYGPTKAALINLCESLKPELDAAGVRLRLVNPGFVATPMTAVNEFPMPFLLSAEDAAELLFTALTTSSRFEITFPKRFTWGLKLLRLLPYGAYFALMRRVDRGRKRG
jgi:NAD(P)-dependent dehydrogenase (short-subunit alcohol dehydrogenase family)